MINIQDIIPFMKKGWVAMYEDGSWWWFPLEPFIKSKSCGWFFRGDDIFLEAGSISRVFDIAPAEDWIKSLIQVKGVK